ncbi:IscS subfamily cysteine desulfurase [Bacillus sp. FSL K6-4563]|uniref:IscS subfamily cysteine desulfurase n=1 Tax=Bacillus sp. FSL K6-4563 TaxID=2921507 RepID=UPI000DE043D1|nr:IscS subfamily cysteine desulfurase [Bacillus pumilus]MED4438871.1 IscS subfamily cysteine desulfurase [Bacillus pumilus]MED4491263.1 IscS subfamily cysteine desulfurase [Bacillus pumilus]
MDGLVYLDYAASTPVSEEALHVFQQLSKDCYGNASSLHDAGGRANDILTYSRQSIAAILEGEPEGIYFTNGGTESNLLAIQSMANGLPADRQHVITTSVEHPSVHHAVKSLERLGAKVTIIEPNQDGIITQDILKDALLPETGLVSIQHANSETGIIQPLAELAPILKERHILFHTDAVQTFGKVRVSIKELGVDAVSISSHKVYAPKGAGAVYMGAHVPWKPLYSSAVQENGFRPGTVNVPCIGAFAAASEQLILKLDEQKRQNEQLRDYFLQQLKMRQLPVRTLQNNGNRLMLPHIIGCFFEGFEGQYVMLACNRHGICISTGSACASGYHHPSPAVKALHVSDRDALQFIRLSFGSKSSKEDIDQLLHTFEQLQKEKKGA